MNGTRAPAVRSEAVQRYAVRIEAHLARLARGHDPMGHLFGIERLARGKLGMTRPEPAQIRVVRAGPEELAVARVTRSGRR